MEKKTYDETEKAKEHNEYNPVKIFDEKDCAGGEHTWIKVHKCRVAQEPYLEWRCDECGISGGAVD